MTTIQTKNNLQLWQFLLQLLNNADNMSIIEWTNKTEAEFKFKNPDEVNIKNKLIL
jgi:hypothetical protein